MLMAGRADPNQKGYDLAAWAVENFLHNMGQAGFVFLPMPGERGFEDLGFISKLALKYPENILVLPFRLQKGYPQIIQACHFGLMPSFYEPFGMANEFYQNGCAGLGRATGGLASQIIDAEMDFSLCPWLVPKTQIKNSTGILFREEIFLEQADSLWQDIFNKNRKDNLQYRKQNPLYASMAKAMESSLFRAVDMCAQRPREFHQMILGGMDYINEAFSWERSAEIYWQTMNANIA
jgi:glycogen synthase